MLNIALTRQLAILTVRIKGVLANQAKACCADTLHYLQEKAQTGAQSVATHHTPTCAAIPSKCGICQSRAQALHVW